MPDPRVDTEEDGELRTQVERALYESEYENMADAVLGVLERELAQLREALREQWEHNHWEHCGCDWLHLVDRQTPCMWPPPPELGALASAVQSEHPKQ